MRLLATIVAKRKKKSFDLMDVSVYVSRDCRGRKWNTHEAEYRSNIEENYGNNSNIIQ